MANKTFENVATFKQLGMTVSNLVLCGCETWWLTSWHITVQTRCKWISNFEEMEYNKARPVGKPRTGGMMQFSRRINTRFLQTQH